MSKTKKKEIFVYTDGSCVRNGKLNAVGGIGIHFPNGDLKDMSKIFESGPCTNQKTELYAILTAIRYINKYIGLDNHKIIIKTDSQYCIDCVTNWIYNWIKNGWKTKNKTPVINKELIETINKYYEKYDIEFNHVNAHTNLKDNESIANSIADSLAVAATKKAIYYQSKNNRKQTKHQGSKNTRSKQTKRQGSKNNYGKKYNNKSFPSNPNFIVELIQSSK